MALRHILFAGATVAAFMSPALAASARAADDDDDYYVCNDHLCYDDQAEATRQLNRQSLQNPGYDDEDMPSYGRRGYDDQYRGRDQYRSPYDDGYRGQDQYGSQDQYGGQYDDNDDQGMSPDDNDQGGDDSY